MYRLYLLDWDASHATQLMRRRRAHDALAPEHSELLLDVADSGAVVTRHWETRVSGWVRASVKALGCVLVSEGQDGAQTRVCVTKMRAMRQVRHQ